MALSQRLDLRQSQSLVMTPQLQQAIKLLQLSNRELSDFVEDELEKNPMLERDEGESSTLQEANSDNMTAYDDAQSNEANAQMTSITKIIGVALVLRILQTPIILANLITNGQTAVVEEIQALTPTR